MRNVLVVYRVKPNNRIYLIASYVASRRLTVRRRRLWHEATKPAVALHPSGHSWAGRCRHEARSARARASGLRRRRRGHWRRQAEVLAPIGRVGQGVDLRVAVPRAHQRHRRRLLAGTSRPAASRRRR
eukprot:scaffold125405_cov62-Phaeocystis_antarctica.AAC.3